MNTDLFVVVSGVDPRRVMAAIPPACRRAIDHAVEVSTDHDVAILDLPVWESRRGARHFLPAFSPLGATPCTFRFELSALVAGRWTPWIATVSIGPEPFDAAPTGADGVSADVDLFASIHPAERVRVRVRVRPARIVTEPWMATLSVCDLDPGETERGAVTSATRLAVPARSQMEETSALRERVCSPTSVAMVLAYWNRPAEVSVLAAEVYHAGLDLYGVWPASIRAAARRGIAGYLLRFPDWATAAWCLDHGMPVIASVRYEAGELSGAAVPRTSGHLLVLTGHQNDDVFVNDPAAPTSTEVARRYRLDELRRIWLARTGVGYILFDPF